MISTLLEQYRRWFEYENNSHRKVLDSLASVPEASRGSEPYQKAIHLLDHMIVGRLVWLNRLGGPVERPAVLFPTDGTHDSLIAKLEIMERAWSEYLQGLTETGT